MRAFVIAVGCLSASLAGCGGKILEGTSDLAGISGVDAGTPSANDPFHAQDDWLGTYTCNGSLTSLDLHIVTMHDDSIDDALFEFDLQGVTGSYHVNGAFDPATSELNLAPGEWVQEPSGYGQWSVVGLAGTVSGDSYSGFVTSTACREFALTKQR